MCLYYIENNEVFTLTNDGGKALFFFYQNPTDKYKKNKKNFFIGRVERYVTPLVL